jgi:hypothetical protein
MVGSVNDEMIAFIMPYFIEYYERRAIKERLKPSMAQPFIFRDLKITFPYTSPVATCPDTLRISIAGI